MNVIGRTGVLCAFVTHAQGYGTCHVCQFVSQSVSLSVTTSNGHNSETTNSIITKRGTGMGSVAFSDVILLKSLSMKREA